MSIVPFVRNPNLQDALPISDGEGSPILTIIVRCNRVVDGISDMISNMPVCSVSSGKIRQSGEYSCEAYGIEGLSRWIYWTNGDAGGVRASPRDE